MASFGKPKMHHEPAGGGNGNMLVFGIVIALAIGFVVFFVIPAIQKGTNGVNQSLQQQQQKPKAP